MVVEKRDVSATAARAVELGGTIQAVADATGLSRSVVYRALAGGNSTLATKISLERFVERRGALAGPEGVVWQMRQWWGRTFEPKRFPEDNGFDQQVEACRAIIREWLPTKTARLQHRFRRSYGLKHDFEAHRYVQEGEEPYRNPQLYDHYYVFEACAVAAMVLEGFDHSRIDTCLGNIAFNYSKPELRKLREQQLKIKRS